MGIHRFENSPVIFLLVIICSAQIMEVAGFNTMIYGSLADSSLAFGQYNQTSPYKYFYAYTLRPTMDGTYSIRSDSPMDPYGYLYNNTFNPNNLELNLIQKDDDSGGNLQFLLTQFFKSYNTYIVVVSTFNERITGNYSISIDGPASVTYSTFNPVSPPSTVAPTTTTGRNYVFSGSLTSSSVLFSPPNRGSGIYYSQAYQVTISTTGFYTFVSNSPMDTYGYLYDSPYYPSATAVNLITSDDDGAGSGQFRLSASLTIGRTYVLIVTTYQERITGSFTITASGPSIPIVNSYWPPSASTPPTQTTLPPVTGPTTQYYGYLYSFSRFARPSGSDAYYYFEALRVQVYSTQSITMTTQSSLDTYGCLYSGTFDPSYPTYNMVTCNDDGASGNQFLITSTLQAGQDYTLVVTTFGPSQSGSYTAKFIGSNSISVSSYSPATARPIQTTTSWNYDFSTYISLSTGAIIGIVCGSIFLIIIIIGAVSAAATATKRQRVNRGVVRAIHVPNAPNYYRNGQTQVACISSPTTGSQIYANVEELPPAYETVKLP